MVPEIYFRYVYSSTYLFKKRQEHQLVPFFSKYISKYHVKI